MLEFAIFFTSQTSMLYLAETRQYLIGKNESFLSDDFNDSDFNNPENCARILDRYLNLPSFFKSRIPEFPYRCFSARRQPDEQTQHPGGQVHRLGWREQLYHPGGQVHLPRGQVQHPHGQVHRPGRAKGGGGAAPGLWINRPDSTEMLMDWWRNNLKLTLWILTRLSLNNCIAMPCLYLAPHKCFFNNLVVYDHVILVIAKPLGVVLIGIKKEKEAKETS